MAGESNYEVTTWVSTLEEGVPILLDAWNSKGLLPIDRDARHQWFRDVMEALKRAYAGDKDWSKHFLVSSRNHDVLSRRVALAMLQVPRFHSDELGDADLDSKNLELISRGKPMQSDEAAADEALKNDAEPRLVDVQEAPQADEHLDDQEELVDGDDHVPKTIECSRHKGCWFPPALECVMCSEAVAAPQAPQLQRRQDSLVPVKDDEPSEVERLRKELARAKSKSKKKSKRKSKSKRRYDDTTDSSESSDSSSDSSSEDDRRCKTVKDAVGNTLSKILNQSMTQSRLRSVDKGDYMSLRVNALLQRNEQVVHKLQKLSRREGEAALVQATMLAEEHERNRKELDLLERGLEEAKLDPELARRTVALVTKDRLKVSSENKEWARAQKHLRSKEKAELTSRLLYGKGSGGHDWDPEAHQPEWRPRKVPRPTPTAGKGGGKGNGRMRPLDAPVVSKGENLDIGPWLPDAERRERTDIQCNFCGGPHAGSWECSAQGAPRWKFKQGQVDKWNQPVHLRQR